MPDLNSADVSSEKTGLMSRRVIVSCVLAAVCVAVLSTRVYEQFERVRVRLLSSSRIAEGPLMAIDLPADRRLSGQPAALIVRVTGGLEPTTLTVALDGRELARKAVPAHDEVRIDVSVGPLAAAPHSLTLAAPNPGWALTYLELANVHGYSAGLASFVIAPHDRTLREPVVPTWMFVAVLLLLIGLRPRADWPAGRTRYLHRVAVGVVLLLFAVALLAPVFSQYRILLSVQTFVLGAAVIYAEPLSRAGKGLSRAVVESRLASAQATPIPWWVTALDVACVILLAAILRSWFGGGYRITLMPGVQLSMDSVLRLWIWLALLLFARHLAWRLTPWHVRIAGWLRAATTSEPLRAAWPPFLTSRLMVSIVGFVAVATIGFETPQPWRALDNDWLDLYARWDSGWYHTIAKQGYPTSLNPELTNPIAFFPGLPLLMRGTSELLDVNMWIAGIVLVVGGFLWGLTYLYRLALLDMPRDQARASLMFLAFYPFAFCYSAVLTESLFLLAAVAAFYHFRKGDLWRAAGFGLLVGFLRPNGFLLCVPLGLLAVLPCARSRGWWPRPDAFLDNDTRWPRLAAQLAAASAPVVGVIAYSAYLQTTIGNPFGWAEAQQAWGRAATEGLNVLGARQAMIEAQGPFAYARAYPIELIEAAAAFFALGAVWPIVRRFGLAYGILVAMAVLPPLISMGSVSLGRYTAPLFPIFLWLGAAVPPERRPYWVALFAAGQAFLAALFFTWRPPY